jgi:hypothetical protein
MSKGMSILVPMCPINPCRSATPPGGVQVTAHGRRVPNAHRPDETEADDTAAGAFIEVRHVETKTAPVSKARPTG